MNTDVVTKKCGRRDCEARIEIRGRHCSRGVAEFKRHVELCKECAEAYCPECCGNLTWRQIVIEKKPGMPHHYVDHPVNCKRCEGTGRLTERQLAQRAADRAFKLHFHDCKTCSAPQVVIAFEEAKIYLGKKKIGESSRSVHAPQERCAEGKKLLAVLRDVGAVIDDEGFHCGWDGLDWSGEPIEWLQPGYREVVVSRRKVDEAERKRWAKEDADEEYDDGSGSEEDVRG